jgi:hypothetical protein
VAEVANELMYEVLKQILSDLAGLKESRQENTAALNAMPTHVIAQSQDNQNLYTILIRHDARLEHIELGLDIVEVT